MKKVSFLGFFMMILLALVACADTETPQALDEFEVQDSGESEEMEMVHRSTSWPFYESVSSLAEAATDVVRVEVLDAREEIYNILIDSESPETDVLRPFLVHRLRVIEVFQGNAQPGDIVEVRLMGGDEMDGATTRSSTREYVHFETGDDVVLFLLYFDDGLPLVLLNPFQAAYKFAPADRGLMATQGVTSGNEALESLHGYSRFTLTLADLAALQIQNFGTVSESFGALLEPESLAELLAELSDS